MTDSYIPLPCIFDPPHWESDEAGLPSDGRPFNRERPRPDSFGTGAQVD
jgi:hypothetical protein